MKFNVTFIFADPDKKDKIKHRVVVMEAPNEQLATEWGFKQAEHWGKDFAPAEVSPFVEETDEEQKSDD